MEISFQKKSQANNLLFLGFLLFFLGLVVGLIVPAMANPRMGLSSHIEGVLNGMFLVILGLVWHKVELSGRWLKATFWMAVYGTFANWAGMLVAAVFDAGEMLTVAANGHKGPAAAEAVVKFSLISLSLAMLFVCVTMMVGLRRNAKLETKN